MRGYMQGALGALFAYGAAWWGTGERAAAPVERGVRAAPVTARADDVAAAQPPAQARSVARPAAPAPSARVTAPMAQAPFKAPVPSPASGHGVAAGEQDPLPGVAAPSDFGVTSIAPTPDSLRQLAEYRQLAESPAALVDRVERFEPTPGQLAEFRRVAAQLFNARPAGSEGESPWAADGTRDGRGSVVRRTEQSAARHGSAR